MAPATPTPRRDRPTRAGARRPRPLLFGASLLAMALPLPAPAQNLIWENQGMTNAFGITSGRAFNYNGATVTLTWSVHTNSSSTFAYAYGSNYVTYQSGMEGGTMGNVLLGFDNSARDTNDWISLTLSFSRVQTNLSFTILDIDQGSWDDGVDVVYNGSTNVRSTPSIWSYAQTNASLRTVITDDETYFEGWEGNNTSSATNQINGNVKLNFTGISISSVTIRFFSTDDANGYGGDPGSQKIGISDLVAVPEPPAITAAALILLILLARRGLGRNVGPDGQGHS